MANSKTLSFRADYVDKQGKTIQRRVVRERDPSDRENKTVSYSIELGITDELGGVGWQLENKLTPSSVPISIPQVVLMALIDAASGGPPPTEK